MKEPGYVAQSVFDDINLAVGQALMGWASVELFIMTAMHSTIRDTAVIWTTLKSFDAKLDIFDRYVRTYTADESIREDFYLLKDHTKKLAKIRNKIAHSTPIGLPLGLVDGQSQFQGVIRPFYSFVESSEEMTVEEVRVEAAKFQELAEAWHQLHSSRGLNNKLPAFPRPPTGLILELRKKRDQNRKEQQERQAALALVKRLKRQGNWPPKEG